MCFKSTNSSVAQFKRFQFKHFQKIFCHIFAHIFFSPNSGPMGHRRAVTLFDNLGVKLKNQLSFSRISHCIFNLKKKKKKTEQCEDPKEPWVATESTDKAEKRLFKAVEDLRGVQRKIKTRMQECEAVYRDETESCLKKDTEKAWQGLQTITGQKPKGQFISFTNEQDPCQ